MRKIDTSKLIDAETVLIAKYGTSGTESRCEFEEKARAYYYGIILCDRRKELKMTQKELAYLRLTRCVYTLLDSKDE